MKSAAGTELPAPPPAPTTSAPSPALPCLAVRPPQDVTVGPRPGDGTTGPRQEAHPDYHAYHQADATAGTDREIVTAYEGFPERHKALYEECASRVDAGRGNPDEMSFVPHYRPSARRAAHRRRVCRGPARLHGRGAHGGRGSARRGRRGARRGDGHLSRGVAPVGP